jgi:hypothetical protein
MKKKLPLAAVVVLACSGTAAAARQPLVPTFVQHLVRAKAGALAYVPTRAPSSYRYLSYRWDAAHRTLTIRVHNRHYAASNARRTASVTAAPFAGSLASCADGKQKTLQYAGNRVYWDGAVAWRCVRGARGNVKLTAAGANLPDVALALLVSSVKRL